MRVAEKEPWDMRFLLTTEYLPKLSKNGLLLGKTFDEWTCIRTSQVFQLLVDSFYSDFTFEERMSEDKEYYYLYFQAGSNKTFFAYRLAIKGEIVSWGGNKGMWPIFGDRITGYTGLMIMDIVDAERPWKELLESNQKQIEEARKNFNKKY